MERDLHTITKDTFDLIVIGGGIIGAGIARDAALRGLKTLLVEKDDFSYGTTSRSSRLVHGGLRYLRQLWFGLVRQDLKEREILLNIAPHLVHRLPFIIPLLKSKPFYRLSLPLGMYMYGLLSIGERVPSWKHLSRQETLQLDPCFAEVNGLLGSYVYYDCQAEFMERLCLENVISANENGACTINHAMVTRILTRGNVVCGVEMKDTLTGNLYEVNGRIVLNAAGPWADCVLNLLNIKPAIQLRKTKGIHLLTHRISDNALVLFAKSDGRLFFVIPWEDCSLIGTTDTDYAGDLDSVFANEADVNYLLTELQHYFPSFNYKDIYYTIAGLRPLAASNHKSESKISRAHMVVDHDKKNGLEGFVSVLGGKITAYRAVAEEAVDIVCRKIGRKTRCRTSEIPLPGAPAVQKQAIEEASNELGLPLATVSHLAAIYGSRFSSVLELVRRDSRLGQPISPNCKDILAQIKFAVEREYAQTISDFLLCRSPLGLQPSQGMDSVENVAREMGGSLHWSDKEKKRQIEMYYSSQALTQYFRKSPS